MYWPDIHGLMFQDIKAVLFVAYDSNCERNENNLKIRNAKQNISLFVHI